MGQIRIKDKIHYLSNCLKNYFWKNPGKTFWNTVQPMDRCRNENLKTTTGLWGIAQEFRKIQQLNRQNSKANYIKEFQKIAIKDGKIPMAPASAATATFPARLDESICLVKSLEM